MRLELPDIPLTPREYWRQFEYQPLTSIDDLLKWVREVERFCARSLEGKAWRLVFRGQPNADHGLLSSLYREIYRPPQPQVQRVTEEMLRTREVDRLRELRLWQLQLHGAGILPALTLLATAQHLGGTTRLIDVTHSIAAGLWFAVEKEDVHDGRVFALTYVEDVSVNEPNLEFGTEPFWHTPEWNWTREGVERILIWTPPPIEKRMARQYGAFLIGRAPLEEQLLRALPTTGQHVERISWRSIMSINKRAFTIGAGPGRRPKTSEILLTAPIPGTRKKAIRRELDRYFAMSERTMYPDFPGYVDWKLGRIGYGRL